MTAITPPPPAPEVYLAFADNINQASVQRLMNNITLAQNAGSPAIHLFFHSAGGNVGDGIALYNFLRALSVDLTIYNAGTVYSIAAVAFLGAKNRNTSAHATFMLHRTTHLPAQPAQAATLKMLAESVSIDDQRSEAIIRSSTSIPEERLALLDKYDVVITPEESVAYGIAQAIREFTPPPGTRIYMV